MTETTRPRANRDGDLCPPWCTADHDEELIPGWFSMAHAGGSTPAGDDVFLSARPCLARGWDAPRVQVTSRARGSLIAEDAAGLAGLVEALAGATPERHLELAAAIRQAAAQVTGA